MRAPQIALLIVFILVAAVAGLFTFQNLPRTEALSLNFGFTGVRTQDEVPVVVLMWISFGSGLLLGGGWGLIRSMRIGRERNRLKAQVARANLKIDV